MIAQTLLQGILNYLKEHNIQSELSYTYNYNLNKKVRCEEYILLINNQLKIWSGVITIQDQNIVCEGVVCEGIDRNSSGIKYIITKDIAEPNFSLEQIKEFYTNIMNGTNLEQYEQQKILQFNNDNMNMSLTFDQTD